MQGDGEIWKISSCISFLWYQVKPRANPLKSVPGMTEAMQSIFQFNWILQQPMNKHSWEPNSPFNTYFHWLSWERRGSFFPCAPPPLPHFIFIFLYEIVFLFSKIKKKNQIILNNLWCDLLCLHHLPVADLRAPPGTQTHSLSVNYKFSVDFLL